MNPVLRNILATLAGLFAGGLVNMGLILIGSKIIAAPEGVDVNDAESIAAHIHLFEPKHFLFPFLAHALGTLAGAFLAVRLSVGKRIIPATVIGIMFLVGGIMAATMIPAPAWFLVLDLAGAYLPMGVLAFLLAKPHRY